MPVTGCSIAVHRGNSRRAVGAASLVGVAAGRRHAHAGAPTDDTVANAIPCADAHGGVAVPAGRHPHPDAATDAVADAIPCADPGGAVADAIPCTDPGGTIAVALPRHSIAWHSFAGHAIARPCGNANTISHPVRDAYACGDAATPAPLPHTFPLPYTDALHHTAPFPHANPFTLPVTRNVVPDTFRDSDSSGDPVCDPTCDAFRFFFADAVCDSICYAFRFPFALPVRHRCTNADATGTHAAGTHANATGAHVDTLTL